MSDRELLTLAAKAAGIGLFVWGAKGAENFTIKHPDGTPGDRWKPQTDDGDALRLAVKLCMEVSCDGSDRVVVGWADVHHPSSAPDRVFYSHVSEPKESDPAAATRRAIVRAAAEIGKALA